MAGLSWQQDYHGRIIMAGLLWPTRKAVEVHIIFYSEAPFMGVSLCLHLKTLFVYSICEIELTSPWPRYY